MTPPVRGMEMKASVNFSSFTAKNTSVLMPLWASSDTTLPSLVMMFLQYTKTASLFGLTTSEISYR